MNRALIALTLALCAAGCFDGASPTAVAQPLFQAAVSDATIHMLRQSPTAPGLQAYRVSFWAKRGTQTTLFVNYRPAPGQTRGDPFLRFRIPINGLVAGSGGVPLAKRDSVFITLTVDPVRFEVAFEPSGVLFSKSSPAQLAIWYQDADPDLNGDGVVDATDEMLQQQVAIWSQATRMEAWKQLSSNNNTTQQYVASELYHFSEYAVSW
jgi:hypothetical protein